MKKFNISAEELKDKCGVLKQKTIGNKPLLFAIILSAGFFLGWLVFAPSNKDENKDKNSAKKEYTCSMHPQIRQDKEGKCPLCGMDLTLVGSDTGNNQISPDAIMLTDEAAALANVQTMVVWEEDGERTLTLYGNIDINERTSQIQSAYVNGRVEKLYINAVGDRVSKGQILALIYSPEVYTATQELISALNYPNDDAQRDLMVKAIREKLLLWNLTQSQIDNIIAKKQATPYIELYANTSGVVVEKNIQVGDYIAQGKPLMRVANLSNLWVVLKAYEKDLPFLRKGQSVTFTCEALGAKEFKGVISYIDEIVDSKTRTADVRVEINNQGGILKPNMYVTANVTANLNDYKGKIIVPKSAVLWSGKHSAVYVKDAEQEQPTFEMRKVELGPAVNAAYIVLNGLKEGEEIAVNGVFQIDAAAQLEGKKSFMN